MLKSKTQTWKYFLFFSQWLIFFIWCTAAFSLLLFFFFFNWISDNFLLGTTKLIFTPSNWHFQSYIGNITHTFSHSIASGITWYGNCCFHLLFLVLWVIYNIIRWLKELGSINVSKKLLLNTYNMLFWAYRILIQYKWMVAMGHGQAWQSLWCTI